ncbi:hypothetical protein NP493_2341g00002 [Ridgeia piscesae]|uniref:Uncharacterized protein n=1 Tax=Ridgeia piscesae TaxID=27915 RepID=A0AAD9JIQ7_RIDPI|nr:hypothetical protein NP493_2341g00002 [Ridgeia piscesae]
MVNVILSLSLVLSVVCVTHGQSTAGDNSGCVYSFKVPTSDCAQTPGPSVDDQIWKSSVIALQEQVRQLTSDMRVLREHNNKLVSDVGRFTDKTESHHSSTGGAVYIRWGRTTCPGNGTTLVYAGKYINASFKL